MDECVPESRHHCVILRNITRDGLDERNRVKKSSTSVEVLDVVPFQEKANTSEYIDDYDESETSLESF